MLPWIDVETAAGAGVTETGSLLELEASPDPTGGTLTTTRRLDLTLGETI